MKNNKKEYQDENDIEKKYKAIEKEVKQNSKPKEVREDLSSFEEMQSDSSYEIYEGLDNLNSFTARKAKKERNFLLRIFGFQSFVNIFSKLLTKLISFVLERSLISHKFLGRFAAKLRKLLIKVILMLQFRLLLLQAILLISRLRLQARMLEKLLSQSSNRVEDKSNNKTFNFSSLKEGNKENSSFLMQDLSLKNQEISKEIGAVNTSSEKSSAKYHNLVHTSVSLVNSSQISYKLDEKFILENKRQDVTNDHLFFRIPVQKIGISEFDRGDSPVFDFILNIAKKAMNFVKDRVDNLKDFVFKQVIGQTEIGRISEFNATQLNITQATSKFSSFEFNAIEQTKENVHNNFKVEIISNNSQAQTNHVLK